MMTSHNYQLQKTHIEKEKRKEKRNYSIKKTNQAEKAASCIDVFSDICPVHIIKLSKRDTFKQRPIHR